VRRLAILGTGLIGASVGLAAKRAGVEHVSGWDPDGEALAVAAGRGALDTPADVGQPLEDCDVRRLGRRVVVHRQVGETGGHARVSTTTLRGLRSARLPAIGLRYRVARTPSIH